MAWYRERDLISAAGPRHGASRRRMPDAFRHFGIGTHLAVRYGLQVIPDAHLKGCSADIERKFEARLGAGQMPRQHIDPLAKLRRWPPHRRELGRGIFAAQCFHKFPLRISKLQEAEAAVSSPEHHEANRRFCRGISDAHTLS